MPRTQTKTRTRVTRLQHCNIGLHIPVLTKERGHPVVSPEDQSNCSDVGLQLDNEVVHKDAEALDDAHLDEPEAGKCEGDKNDAKIP